MTALSPGASPPPVMMRIFWISTRAWPLVPLPTVLTIAAGGAQETASRGAFAALAGRRVDARHAGDAGSPDGNDADRGGDRRPDRALALAAHAQRGLRGARPGLRLR